MLKRISTRNSIIIALCITIICLGVAFCYLSVKKKTCTSKEIYDISIIEIKKSNVTKGGVVEPLATTELSNDSLTADFNITLTAPKDTVDYTVIIKNKGSVKAIINKVIEQPSYANEEATKSIYPAVISHNSIDGHILAPGEEISINISFQYLDTPNPLTINIPYQINILASASK